MNHATLEFLKQRFSSYYRRGTLIMPPALEQREWGFIYFDIAKDIRMRRHMGFVSRREVVEYLRTIVPAHAFYSTAYYAFPAAGTMNEKGWSGADLIFDLDADHIARGSYAEMLARVKEETQKLLVMLTVELGFSKKEIEIVFSGGRGYHVHVRDIGVREWSGQERRELVDYVRGIGIDPKIALSGVKGAKPGWRERYRQALRSTLDAIRNLDRPDAERRLTAIEGIGPKTASAFLDTLDSTMELLSRTSTDVILADRILRTLDRGEFEGFMEHLRKQAVLTDEPVTTDIKRLIRMPTSLHGGSGLRVTPVRFTELEDFDPLIDAVVFGDHQVDVDIPQSIPYPVPMLGSVYRLEKGMNSIPEALAVYLCCRGVAEFAGGG